jgi:hypothetical protein
MNGEHFSVRRMRTDEVRLIREWADALRWNPGTHDGPAFFAQDPDGFFLGELAGEPIACISCVRYGDHFGFFGQFIVRPEYQGQGYGLVIGRAGRAHLAGRCIGLDGVLNRVGSYERFGFRIAHHHIRYMGTGGGNRPNGLVNLAELPFAQLVEYDSQCFPAPRDEFLREWLRLPGVTALGLPAGDRLAGFGVIRPSTLGFKIGPLFADDVETATRILAGLIASVPKQSFCIDAPETQAQPGTDELVRAFGLTEVFRTARMYTADPPPHDKTKVFGVTSLELG